MGAGLRPASEADVVDAACARLRAAGCRLTGQRRALVRVFASLGRWCTPRELHVEARRRGQEAGVATVYRLIDALLAAGLCRSFAQPDHTLRYVFCPPFHHHHLICVRCGRVADLTDCRLDPPVADFAVQDHAVDFFGECGTCSGGAAASDAAPPRDRGSARPS